MSKDDEIMQVAADLDRLLEELRGNVTALNRILLDAPESHDDGQEEVPVP